MTEGAPPEGDANTVDETATRRRPGTKTPGLIVVHAGTTPCVQVLGLERGRLTFGRNHRAIAGLDDDRVSREHFDVSVVDGCWTVRDRGSRNGTSVDGVQVRGTVRLAAMPRVIRAGHTIAIASNDVTPFAGVATLETDDGVVAGPATRAAREAIAEAGRSSPTLLLRGESGTGKEIAARWFHALGPNARGPMVAVNCAAIPEGVAERVLFGATRGAYSGATGTNVGYFQAADGGALFLDEIAELDMAVQGKLLRATENGEVLMLGETRARKVDVRICCATHRDLRELVSERTFRSDLYYRIGAHEVVLAPLHSRAEEIPWLATQAVRRVDKGLGVHARLVEECILRPWPGNVRELLHAMEVAARAALREGEGVVRVDHLRDDAGKATETDAAPVALDRAAIEQALAASDGSVAGAARTLKLHRTQLYRLLRKHGIEPRPEPH